MLFLSVKGGKLEASLDSETIAKLEPGDVDGLRAIVTKYGRSLCSSSVDDPENEWAAKMVTDAYTPKPWAVRSNRSGGTVHARPGLYAKHAEAGGNAAEIEEHYNYAGSPPPAFGFTAEDKDKKWPVVTLHVALPYGREDLRTKLSAELRAFVDAFLAENDLG